MQDRDSHGKPIEQLVSRLRDAPRAGPHPAGGAGPSREARRQRTHRASPARVPRAALGPVQQLPRHHPGDRGARLAAARRVGRLDRHHGHRRAERRGRRDPGIEGGAGAGGAEEDGRPQRAGDPRRPPGDGPGPRDRRRRHRPAGGRQLRPGGRAPLRELQPQGRGGLAHRRVGAGRQGPRGGARPGDSAGRPQEHRLHGHADHLRARQGPRHLHGHEHADRPHRADDPVLRGREHAAPEEARASGQGPRHRVPRDLRHRLRLWPLPRHAHRRRASNIGLLELSGRPSARTSSTSS